MPEEAKFDGSTRAPAAPNANPRDGNISVVFGDEGSRAYELLTGEYRATLMAPPDDMWSSFADQAEKGAVRCGDEMIGSVSIDATGALHRFFVRLGFEHLNAAILEAVQRSHRINTMVVSTSDPGAATALLPSAVDITPVALLYAHDEPPEGSLLDDIRPAVESDHERATAFFASATGAPLAFLDGYLRERIDRRELLVHELDGELAAIGERRIDRHAVGTAHLGMVVSELQRGRGLGGAMMNTLVSICAREQLTPVCSTEPDNLAAQQAIRRAGFRSRHSVLRITPRDPAAVR